jgi:hypothetical protein
MGATGTLLSMHGHTEIPAVYAYTRTTGGASMPEARGLYLYSACSHTWEAKDIEYRMWTDRAWLICMPSDH